MSQAIENDATLVAPYAPCRRAVAKVRSELRVNELAEFGLVS